MQPSHLNSNPRSFSVQEKLRKEAMALPEVYENICHGTMAFYIGNKMFVRLKEDGTTIALYNKERDEWIAKNGDVFFITDHYKNYPMLLVDLLSVDRKDLIDLLQTSWSIRVTKSIFASLKKNL